MRHCVTLTPPHHKRPRGTSLLNATELVWLDHAWTTGVPLSAMTERLPLTRDQIKYLAERRGLRRPPGFVGVPKVTLEELQWKSLMREAEPPEDNNVVKRVKRFPVRGFSMIGGRVTP